MLAVAPCLENAHQRYVHDVSDRTGKIPAEVFDGFRKHILRGPHQLEQHRSDDNSEHRQENSGDESERHRRMHGGMHLFIILCADVLANNNACADENAVDKADQQKNKVAGRADGSERLLAKDIADYKGVDNIV